MPYWILAFVVGLMVVIGYAAGPLGAIMALIAFAIALFMLWAYKLGFPEAWTRFGLDRYTAPLMDRRNWDRFVEIFGDNEKLGKACTISVVLIAVWLILPRYQASIVLVAIAAWYIFEIYRAHRPLPRSSAPATLDLPATREPKDENVFKTADTLKSNARVN